jgi:hypothetical protein
MATEAMVNISVYQFLNKDENPNPVLNQADEFGISMFRRIFAYFGRENFFFAKQYEVLTKIVKKIIVDVN